MKQEVFKKEVMEECVQKDEWSSDQRLQLFSKHIPSSEFAGNTIYTNWER